MKNYYLYFQLCIYVEKHIGIYIVDIFKPLNIDSIIQN